MRKLVFALTALALFAGAAFASPVSAFAAGHPHMPRDIGVQARGGSAKLNALQPSFTCDGAFHAQPSPNGIGNNYLYGTAAVSANDVWAVGTYNSSLSTIDRTLIEHWNGNQWSVMASPNPNQYLAVLTSVASFNSHDVWAVGFYQRDGVGNIGTLTEHWDGVSWSIKASLNPFPAFNAFYGVAMIATNDVWAVGSSNSAGFFTLAEHWNGTVWTVMSSPNQPATGGGFASNQLFAVSSLSTGDVWAIGSYVDTTKKPLAEHWDGANWSLINAPDGSPGDAEIFGVAALEIGRAVGVGYVNRQVGVTPAVPTEWDLHSSGTNFAATEPAPGSGDSAFEGIDRGLSGVWAVGFQEATMGAAPKTLATPATWDAVGHTLTWGLAPAPSDNPSSTNNVLYTVSSLSPNAFWAAGFGTGPVQDLTQTQFECSLHLGMTAPAAAFVNESLSITVTAKDPSAATLTSYRGTVHFASSDPSAVLPADYKFSAVDAGVHTFTGVVMNTLGNQKVAVGDNSTPFVSASVFITLTCAGPCQSAAGTPGGRTGGQSTGGASGGRGANGSPARTGGPRFTAQPVAAAPLPSRAVAVRAPETGVAAPRGRPIVAMAHVAGVAPAETPLTSVGIGALAAAVVSPQPGWWMYMLVAVPLALAFASRRRRRSKSPPPDQ